MNKIEYRPSSSPLCSTSAHL